LKDRRIFHLWRFRRSCRHAIRKRAAIHGGAAARSANRLVPCSPLRNIAFGAGAIKKQVLLSSAHCRAPSCPRRKTAVPEGCRPYRHREKAVGDLGKHLFQTITAFSNAATLDLSGFAKITSLLVLPFAHEDLAIILGGYVVVNRLMLATPVAVSIYGGMVASDFALYAIGAAAGAPMSPPALEPVIRTWVRSPQVARAAGGLTKFSNSHQFVISHAALAKRACPHIRSDSMFRTACTIAALLAALAMPAQATDVMAGKLKISAPWARATPKGAPVGGGYLTITNMGSESDRLIGGVTGICKSVEVHEMKMDKGIMKMREMASGLEVKPGQTVTLDPEGDHIMFMGMKQPLKKGQHVKVTLQFTKAGKVDVDFTVEGIGAMHGGGGGIMPGMKMQH
jgi:copper(I)-binding protein